MQDPASLIEDPRRNAMATLGCRAFAMAVAALMVLLVACGGGSSVGSDLADPTSTDDADGSGQTLGTPALSATASASGANPSPSEADGDAPFVPEDSVDTVDKRLNVTVNGKIVYIKNGGQVVLGGGRVIEIYLDPYPPTTLRTYMDVYLEENGEPLDDAGIGMEYDMLAMVHGPFFGEAEKVGDGHYLLTLDYIMFGAWDQTVTIRIGLDRIRVPVVVVAYP